MTAESALTEYHRYRSYLALCGEELPVSELPSSSCPTDCERWHVYCMGCIRTANERNWDAGIDVDCPPGVHVQTDR